MTELFKSLKDCEQLHTLIVNDNWLKTNAAAELSQLG